MRGPCGGLASAGAADSAPREVSGGTSGGSGSRSCEPGWPAPRLLPALLWEVTFPSRERPPLHGRRCLQPCLAVGHFRLFPLGRKARAAPANGGTSPGSPSAAWPHPGAASHPSPHAALYGGRCSAHGPGPVQRPDLPRSLRGCCWVWTRPGRQHSARAGAEKAPEPAPEPHFGLGTRTHSSWPHSVGVMLSRRALLGSSWADPGRRISSGFCF